MTKIDIKFLQEPLSNVSATIRLLQGGSSDSIEEPPMVGDIIESKELVDLFQAEIPLVKQISPDIQLMAKLYELRLQSSCVSEVNAWSRIRKSPYFHLTPAVLPQAYRIKITSGDKKGNEYLCILMQKAVGKRFDKWFEVILRISPNPPIVFHQFFSLWFQLFQFLKFLHLDAPPFHHADIKPENLIVSNNALRFIDFNAAIIGTYGLPHGTAQYVPNSVLDETRISIDRNPSFHLDYFDLFCTGIMLLEVFTAIATHCNWSLEVNLTLKKLQECFDRKRKISESEQPDETRWRKLKDENDAIRDLLATWKKNSTSTLAKRFSELLDETNLTVDDPTRVSDIYENLLSPSKSEYIECALHDIGFKHDKGSLMSDQLETGFSGMMADLLTNYTRNVFSNTYPPQYFYHSHKTKGYDEQAVLALDFVEDHFLHLGEDMSCLDVGCAFGTAALHAAKRGFKNITCLDNNPYFHLLSGILWSSGASNKIDEYLSPFKELFKAVYGEGSESQLRDLIQEYNRIFLENGSESWLYKMADYWKLGAAQTRGIRDKYDLIICNNFIHWPVIDFEHMREDCAHFYDQDSHLGNSYSGLQRLLHPLLNRLKRAGCLVIVEPSGFCEDDTNYDFDKDFHNKRFTNNPLYKEAHIYARETLANNIWKFDLGENKDRQPLFLRSRFEELSKFGHQVEFVAKSHELKSTWSETILGEFTMTLRNLPEDKLMHISSNPESLIEFYGKFNTYLAKQVFPKEPPTETVYVIKLFSE